jgi:two-component system response regulator HydG
VHAATENVGRQLVVSALRQTGGNKSEAARILGITRKTLQRKINRFEIEVDELRG